MPTMSLIFFADAAALFVPEDSSGNWPCDADSDEEERSPEEVVVLRRSPGGDTALRTSMMKPWGSGACAAGPITVMLGPMSMPWAERASSFLYSLFRCSSTSFFSCSRVA